MTHSGRTRHRDRELSRRQIDEEPSATARVFRITDVQRHRVCKFLRYIDEATRALEGQHNKDNRELIRVLRSSADHIFDLISGLEEAGI